MTLWKAAGAVCASRPPTGVTAALRREISQVTETEGATLRVQRALGVAPRPLDLDCDRGGSMSESATLRTPLHALHVELGARMAPFAGYDMPIQYRVRHSRRTSAHPRPRRPVRRLAHGPGVARRARPRDDRRARSRRSVPADVLGLAPGRQRYSQLLNAEGGIDRRPDGLAAAGRATGGSTWSSTPRARRSISRCSKRTFRPRSS